LSVKSNLLAGAHMSIAGGLFRAFERGQTAGCRTIQIFLKNSNHWRAKPITAEDRILFLRQWKESGISPVMAHASYLINLASPDAALYRKSLDALIEEMRRANTLEISWLICHPGAHKGAGLKPGIIRIAEALTRALEIVEPPIAILMESTAGQGSCIGHRFEHLAAILEKIRCPDRIGVCLDTCHIFASGYDIRTRTGYEKTIKEFKRLMDIKKIKAIHVNDSKRELGSRVDRHCHIGQGCIGLEAFRCIVNDSRFAKVPKILETPKGPGLEEDIKNLSTLNSLLEKRERSTSTTKL
jgi:deoxyribonuclease IV